MSTKLIRETFEKWARDIEPEDTSFEFDGEQYEDERVELDWQAYRVGFQDAQSLASQPAGGAVVWPIAGDELIMTGHGVLNPRVDGLEHLAKVVAGIRDEYSSARTAALDQMEMWAAQGDTKEVSVASTEAERHASSLTASSRILRLLEDYISIRTAAPSPNGDGNRDARQTTVANWCRDAFGAGQASSVPQRGVRLLEEAIEAAQAAGADRDMAHKLVDYIFDRPAGELSQELGGVGVTVLALAAAAGLSADQAECTEIARVLAKPLSHFAARNQTKNDAGFLATPQVQP